MSMNPRLTSLCYLECDGQYLILHRTKKDHDENHDKWIGVGGKFEDGESPEECALREVKEETGLTMTEFRLRGIVTFVSDEWGTEYMHLFTCTAFEGELADCDEGELVWLPKAELLTKKMWEGDKIFLKALDERGDFFSLKLRYRGETLVEAAFGGETPLVGGVREKTLALDGNGLPADAQALKGRVFEHFKGNRYRLVDFAVDSETLEPTVVYRPLDGAHKLWVRPAKMFFENVSREGYLGPRFRLVEE
jgi:8-oxo-dGTP diphosphatase